MSDINEILAQLAALQESVSQLTRAVAVLVGDPDLQSEVGVDVLEKDPWTGAVKLRKVEDLKENLRQEYRGDHEALMIIQAYPDYFLWQGVAKDEETKKKILLNGGEREAFIVALLGVRRFFSPFDDYDVTIYDHATGAFNAHLIEDGRRNEIAVAFETKHTDPWSQEEVTELAMASLERKLDDLERKREAARIGAPDFSPS